MASVTADGLPLLDSFLKESMRYNSIDASKITLIKKFRQNLPLTSYMSKESNFPIYLLGRIQSYSWRLALYPTTSHDA